VFVSLLRLTLPCTKLPLQSGSNDNKSRSALEPRLLQCEICGYIHCATYYFYSGTAATSAAVAIKLQVQYHSKPFLSTLRRAASTAPVGSARHSSHHEHTIVAFAVGIIALLDSLKSMNSQTYRFVGFYSACHLANGCVYFMCMHACLGRFEKILNNRALCGENGSPLPLGEQLRW
jgi:hypothetical protein